MPLFVPLVAFGWYSYNNNRNRSFMHREERAIRVKS